MLSTIKSFSFFTPEMKRKFPSNHLNSMKTYEEIDRELEEDMVYNRPEYNCSYYGDPYEYDWYNSCWDDFPRRRKWDL